MIAKGGAPPRSCCPLHSVADRSLQEKLLGSVWLISRKLQLVLPTLLGHSCCSATLLPATPVQGSAPTAPSAVVGRGTLPLQSSAASHTAPAAGWAMPPAMLAAAEELSPPPPCSALLLPGLLQHPGYLLAHSGLMELNLDHRSQKAQAQMRFQSADATMNPQQHPHTTASAQGWLTQLGASWYHL